MKETQIQSLGWEDLLAKGMATHFSILAWRIPWTEESGRPQFMEYHCMTTSQGCLLQTQKISHSVRLVGGLVAKSCPTVTIPWSIASQASLSMGFSRQEY